MEHPSRYLIEAVNHLVESKTRTRRPLWHVALDLALTLTLVSSLGGLIYIALYG